MSYLLINKYKTIECIKVCARQLLLTLSHKLLRWKSHLTNSLNKKLIHGSCWQKGSVIKKMPQQKAIVLIP